LLELKKKRNELLIIRAKKCNLELRMLPFIPQKAEMLGFSGGFACTPSGTLPLQLPDPRLKIFSIFQRYSLSSLQRDVKQNSKLYFKTLD
jgi:hypothetical protein